jgi:hypothetical protein
LNASIPRRTRIGFGIITGALELLAVAPITNIKTAKSIGIIFLRFMRDFLSADIEE